jgi:hypothetical protein
MNRANAPGIPKVHSQFFDAGTWEWTAHKVNIFSNSPVSNLSFNPQGALVRFDVEGKTGTTGFCRVTIPKELLYSENDWIVLADDNQITPTISEDEDSTYLYFTYDNSAETVEIIGTDAIPEFPSWAIFPLVLTIILFLVIIKRNISKHENG